MNNFRKTIKLKLFLALILNNLTYLKKSNHMTLRNRCCKIFRETIITILYNNRDPKKIIFLLKTRIHKN